MHFSVKVHFKVIFTYNIFVSTIVHFCCLQSCHSSTTSVHFELKTSEVCELVDYHPFVKNTGKEIGIFERKLLFRFLYPVYTYWKNTAKFYRDFFRAVLWKSSRLSPPLPPPLSLSINHPASMHVYKQRLLSPCTHWPLRCTDLYTVHW